MNRMLLAAIAIGTLLTVQHPFAQGTAQAEKLLAAADHRATVDGDLKGAIDDYKKAVAAAGTNRALAAQGLLRMAAAYRKLGDQEAQKIYQRLLREFSDQEETVAEARRFLNSDRPASTDGPINRRVWAIPCGCDVFGSVSPDGRYIPYMDYSTAFMLHDVRTGTDRRLSADPDGSGEVFASLTGAFSFSRNGRQLAYSWETYKTGTDELRVVDLEGSGVPPTRTLVQSDEITLVLPHDWSPDGRWIAVAIRRKDRSSQIGLVSTVDGALRVLKSVDWRGPTHMAFSPDGKYLAFDLAGDIFTLATDLSRESPVVVHAADDVLVGWSPDGSRLLFTSDRAGSHSLWSVPVVNGAVQGAPESIKRDMGDSIATAGVTPGGALYSVVYDGKTIGNRSQDIFEGTFDFATGNFLSPPALAVTTVVGTNRQPDWSPDGRYVSYLSRDFTLAIRTVATGEIHEVSLTRWLAYTNSIQWSADSRSFLVVGTDLKGRPGIFRLNTGTGETRLLFEPESGSRSDVSGIAESPDGRFLYHRLRSPDRSSVSLIRRDLSNGQQDVLLRRTDIAVGVMLSPDSRFLLAMSTDAATRDTSILTVPVDGSEPHEVMRGRGLRSMMWSPDSRSVFVQKGSELWRAPIDGAPPTKTPTTLDPTWVAFRVHPDGRRIAIQANRPAKYAEVWALENFLPRSAAKR